jgi:hypothetical protein
MAMPRDYWISPNNIMMGSPVALSRLPVVGPKKSKPAPLSTGELDRGLIEMKWFD